ncbi:hypothetical protein ACLEEB_00760 [Lonsdalea quercina]|uniref:hypothetical protein n=1 Tax=Lonsdalea quercina TaxID=71657 RepID=UPI003975B489
MSIAIESNAPVVKSREGALTSTLRWLIAALFVATPLNPYISDMTVYLWLPLVFLDFHFLALLKKVNLKPTLFILLFLSFCLLIGRIDIAVKGAAISLGVIYLIKVGRPIVDKIFVCLIFSALWCVLQFIAFQFGQEYSAMLGPSAISTLLWGAYATETYTNQYVVFFLPRMSGLSREAGFFVSLLLITFIIRARDKKLTKKEILIFILAFMFSLSKVSLVLFIFLFLYLLRHYIRKIPVNITIIAFIFLSVCLANYLNVGSPDYFYDHESFAHRFSPSYLLTDMKLPNLLFGCDREYQCFNTSQPIIGFFEPKGLKPNIGLSGILVEMGLLGLATLFLASVLLKLDSYDMGILICFTQTVTLFTVDSFIILTYYYIITNKQYR